MSSWKSPTYHGECRTCGLIIDEGTRKLTDAALAEHKFAHKGHETGWVAVCGCLLARFGPGPEQRAHQLESDYEPLAFDEGDGS